MKRIAARLAVSPASVFKWTKDIELTSAQIQTNRSGPRGPQNPAQIAKRAAAWKLKNRERRLAHQLDGRRRAREADPLHIAGCMLYWAEGVKDRNRVNFANSDIEMVRLFVKFLRVSVGVPRDDLRVRLNVYTGNGLCLEEIENHWLEALDLPRSSLRSHVIDHFPTSSSGSKPARLPYGVCTIMVARSTWLTQHIFGAIQEYGGFEQPAWVDCLHGKRGRPTDSSAEQ